MQPALLEEILNNSTPVERLTELASYDSTPAECLCFLAKSRQNRVIEAVAQNPNTPPHILEELFGRYPVEVLNNSAIQLLLLETPNFLDKIVSVENDNCDLFFEFDNLPDFFINWAISHPNKLIRIYVAKSSKTTLRYLAMLSRDKDESVRLAVALNPVTTSGLSKIILEQLAFSNYFAIRCCVAKETKNIYILNKLALDQHVHVRCEVAENKFAPPTALELLSKDTDINVLRLVAENHNTPNYVLEVLAQDQYEKPFNEGILAGVAQNPNTPTEILELLFEKFPIQVLNNNAINLLILENKNFLTKLCQGNRPIFYNIDLPLCFLEQVIKNQDVQVNIAIAQRTYTPNSILEKLAQDQNDYIRCKVAENRNTANYTLESLAKDKIAEVRRLVAKHHNTPIHILELLAKDSNQMIRTSVASNVNAPEHILELLGKDNKSVMVRRAVAENRKTPSHVLKHLVNDKCEKVRVFLAGNTNTPVSVLEQLAQDEVTKVRIMTAQNNKTPANSLDNLANDKNEKVKLAVAHNVSCSLNTLKLLTEDDNENIRYVAKRNMENRYK